MRARSHFFSFLLSFLSKLSPSLHLVFIKLTLCLVDGGLVFLTATPRHFPSSLSSPLVNSFWSSQSTNQLTIYPSSFTLQLPPPTNKQPPSYSPLSFLSPETTSGSTLLPDALPSLSSLPPPHPGWLLGQQFFFLLPVRWEVASSPHARVYAAMERKAGHQAGNKGQSWFANKKRVSGRLVVLSSDEWSFPSFAGLIAC